MYLTHTYPYIIFWSKVLFSIVSSLVKLIFYLHVPSQIWSATREKGSLRFPIRSYQISRLNYRDQLENYNFACSKLRSDTFQRMSALAQLVEC